ncbi:hypothetical protein FXN63_24625 [Pigmentiphaga aceris]|uniref:Uncharacterized protein n=1 Tax=Pigmentiphaga aceris TaxID=1940612 RepID=A0A5C0B337_9BURK|nr:hypothetical protein [Pigmentiphaga aceris]QEI08675.1 hypothetical protein FXN63_24625 [Pigmentiphaga aceris]
MTLIGVMGTAGLMYMGAKKDPHFTRKMQMRVVLAECLRAKSNPAAGVPRAEIAERCSRLVQGIQQRVGAVH